MVTCHPHGRSDPSPHPTSKRNPWRTRAQILAPALQEFSAKGLAGARMDAIARRARVNKRMLYPYFGGNEALFHAILCRKLAQGTASLHFPAMGMLLYAGRASLD